MRAIYGGKPVNISKVEIPAIDLEQRQAGKLMAQDEHKLLFSVPGAGKTLTALEALANIFEDYGPDYVDDFYGIRVLIVVPSIGLRNWITWTANFLKEEFDYTPLIQVIKSGNEEIHPDAKIVIVTYDLLSRDNGLKTQFLAYRAHVFIADESQNMKPGTARTKKILTGRASIASVSKWKWLLTGTPIERYADDLWPSLVALFPHVLRRHRAVTLEDFRKKFCLTKIARYGRMQMAKMVVYGSQREDVLHEILFKSDPALAIRLSLKIDVEVVEREITLEKVKFSKELQELETKLSEHDDDEDSAQLTVALRMLGEETVPEAGKYIEQLFKSGVVKRPRGVLVLFWHRNVGAKLASFLSKRGLKVRVINGSVVKRDRENIEDAFNRGDLDCVIGQIQAMGTSINLQSNCNYVVFAEESWSDAKSLQAFQRVYRRGQKHNVTVDYLSTMSYLSGLKPRVSLRKMLSAEKVLDGSK